MITQRSNPFKFCVQRIEQSCELTRADVELKGLSTGTQTSVLFSLVTSKPVTHTWNLGTFCLSQNQLMAKPIVSSFTNFISSLQEQVSGYVLHHKRIRKLAKEAGISDNISSERDYPFLYCYRYIWFLPTNSRQGPTSLHMFIDQPTESELSIL